MGWRTAGKQGRLNQHEQSSSDLTETAVAHTGAALGPLRIYHGFQFSGFMFYDFIFFGIPERVTVSYAFWGSFPSVCLFNSNLLVFV